MEKRKTKGYGKLRGYFTENNITREEVAKLLDINRSTLSSKLNKNKADFTIEEVRLICLKYGLDMNEFFLI